MEVCLACVGVCQFICSLFNYTWYKQHSCVLHESEHNELPSIFLYVSIFYCYTTLKIIKCWTTEVYFYQKINSIVTFLFMIYQLCINQWVSHNNGALAQAKGHNLSETVLCNRAGTNRVTQIEFNQELEFNNQMYILISLGRLGGLSQSWSEATDLGEK